MRIRKHILATAGLIILTTISANAQKVALKTNLLYDATTTVNLGIEFGLAPKWTMDISGNYNPWNLPNGRIIKHAMVQPEFRYWFCDRFSRHFIGFHALGGIYNVGNLPMDFKYLWLDFSPLQDHRFQGWGVGGGLVYGYDVILGKHWNLEFELGAGYIYTQYDEYVCTTCGKKLAEKVPAHYVGPTKAAISLVYLF